MSDQTPNEPNEAVPDERPTGPTEQEADPAADQGTEGQDAETNPDA